MKNFENNLPESSICETEMGPLEYAIIGEGSPVLSFHGGPGGYDQPLYLFDFFAEAGLSLISISRPGYLRTPLSTGKTIGEQADAAAALLDKLGYDKVGVVGASAGGPPTYEFAIRHPGKTAAIVVIDGICRKYKMPDQAGKVQQALFLSDPGLKFELMLGGLLPKSVVREILKTEGRLTKEELKERVRHVMTDDKKIGYVFSLFRSMYPYSRRKEGVWNDVEQYGKIDRLDLGKITAPSLIIHGMKDADVDFGDGEYAASTIPGAEHLWIEDGTHLAFWTSDQAYECQETAVKFLKKYLVQEEPGR